MKESLHKKYGRLLRRALLYLGIYLLLCLLVPPLLGAHKKSDVQLTLPAPAAERICFVDSNEDALHWRLRLIASAQEELQASTFDFCADNSGTDVIAALWDAAERGVRVRLIVDGISAQLHLIGSDAFRALAAHENTEIKFYNPIRLTAFWRVNYRCHDKYLVIDRSVYLFGGRNTSDLFLGSGGEARRNRDHDVVVYGDSSAASSVSTLLRYFDDIWSLDTNWEFHSNGEKQRVQEAAEGLSARWAQLNDASQLPPIDWDAEMMPANGVTLLHGDCSAWNKEPALMNTLGALMREAKESVVVQTPYIICDRAMYDTLEAAAGGTAQVQIITNAPQSGANPCGCVDYLNHKGRILRTGVSLCEWSGERSMHTKTLLIDDRLSLIGSFNWDMRSAYLDTELMLLVDSPTLNAALRAETDEMIGQSRLLMPDGTTAEGEAYTAPAASPVKLILYTLLRPLILPLRYLL